MKLANILKTLLVMVLAMTCLSAGGCGYTTKSMYDTGIKSVAVPIATRGKEVYRREVEDRLTEAVDKRIELDTPYKVVDKTRADTELSIAINEIRQSVLSKDPTNGLARELEITYFINFTWTDLRSGRIIKQHKNFRVSATYIPLQPLNEDFFEGSEDVTNQIAQRIVEQMELDW